MKFAAGVQSLNRVVQRFTVFSQVVVRAAPQTQVVVVPAPPSATQHHRAEVAAAVVLRVFGVVHVWVVILIPLSLLFVDLGDFFYRPWVVLLNAEVSRVRALVVVHQLLRQHVVDVNPSADAELFVEVAVVAHHELNEHSALFGVAPAGVIYREVHPSLDIAASPVHVCLQIV